LMAFSATDAVFEGFRVVRRQPMTLVYWTLFYIVMFALAAALLGPNLVQLISSMEALEGVSDPAPEDFMPILQMYMGIFAVALPVSLIASAIVYAAVSRAVLRPEDRRFGYLRLGRDELRVAAVILVIGLLFLALAVALFTLGGLIGSTARAAGAPWLWLLAILVGLGGIVGCIWLAVRLSLAVPITMAEGRIAIFDSFRLTRGRFWPLLGMAILAGVMSIVVGLLGSLVLTPLQLFAVGPDQLSGLQDQGLQAVLQGAWPIIVVWIITNAVVSALQVAVLYAPFSAAYRQLAGETPRT
jgi:hypothetical protein